MLASMGRTYALRVTGWALVISGIILPFTGLITFPGIILIAPGVTLLAGRVWWVRRASRLSDQPQRPYAQPDMTRWQAQFPPPSGAVMCKHGQRQCPGVCSCE